MADHRSAKDITGMRSGRLTAIRRTDQTRRNCHLWLCKCDCGNEILTEPYKIRNGIIQSCGCSRKLKNAAEIAGQKFGSVTAIRRLDMKRGSNYLWECRCDCGKTFRTTANALLSGNTKSCGCMRSKAIRKTMKKHGTIIDHVHLIDGTCVEKLESSAIRSDNTSGVRGVHPQGGRWVATIGFQGKSYYLGIYSDLEKAAQVRRQAEKELHGTFLEWYHSTLKKEIS